MNSARRNQERARAYPEPPASSSWHRHGPKHQPLTPEQQQHHRDALTLALHTGRRRTHPTTTTTERTP
jgi:hypothetical protein